MSDEPGAVPLLERLREETTKTQIAILADRVVRQERDVSAASSELHRSAARLNDVCVELATWRAQISAAVERSIEKSNEVGRQLVEHRNVVADALDDHKAESSIGRDNLAKEVAAIKELLAGHAGEKRVMEGIQKSWVTPIVRTALTALLAGGIAWLVGRGAPAGAASQAAQEAAERAAESAAAKVIEKLQAPKDLRKGQ